MSDVINIADYTGNATQWDAEQMLQDAIHEVRSGTKAHKKAMIIWLDDEDKKYQVSVSQCGMTFMECMLLCEVAQDILKQRIYGN